MSDLSSHNLGRDARRLRVDTLIRLRWLAVAGQLAALILVRVGFGFPLPVGWCLLTIAASAGLNIALRLVFKRNDRLEDREAGWLLTFDLFQLAALLYLTGGIDNPFVMLALAPVVIGAVSLSRWRAAALLALMIVLTFLLTLYHWPLPWVAGEIFALPGLYRIGIWVALSISGVFVSIYAARVAEEARLLSDGLAATELVLAREQHLSQLDGLAAAAAHELGTPLATIALVAKELSRNCKAAPDPDDLLLLTQQARRCRDILGKLTSLGHDDGFLTKMSLGALIEEIVAPHRDFGVTLSTQMQGEGPEPQCLRSPGIIYGLGNLVENAVDFARDAVRVSADWSQSHVAVAISDDGPGFAHDLLPRLGEPYVTTRGGDRKTKSDLSSGLGLGLFIAKTLLERSGAVVSIGNNAMNAPGALIRIEWPRQIFEIGVAAATKTPDPTDERQ